MILHKQVQNKKNSFILTISRQKFLRVFWIIKLFHQIQFAFRSWQPLHPLTGFHIFFLNRVDGNLVLEAIDFVLPLACSRRLLFWAVAYLRLIEEEKYFDIGVMPQNLGKGSNTTTNESTFDQKFLNLTLTFHLIYHDARSQLFAAGGISSGRLSKQLYYSIHSQRELHWLSFSLQPIRVFKKVIWMSTDSRSYSYYSF